jgi:alanyl-tRNA synthetase
MRSNEVRKSFLRFFEDRGHAIVPSAPVVPYDDPTLLFANAGMNQFKDVFLGAGRRPYTRAADTQKCIRVSGKHNDLEEVGRDTYHHTFFEMLGNWSFGDYYKKEAIEWAWNLLTRVWGLPKNRLWATVYKEDEEAERLWKTVTDIDPNHVLRFGEKDNFWEMGETGPCGPCSEIHIDRTPGGTATAAMVNVGTPDVIEIWNLVFIQYNRDAEGKLTPLPAKHVDTGMGFERICAVLQSKESNYDTDVFTPLIRRICDLTGKNYVGGTAPTDADQVEIDTAIRVIADHSRALTFAIGDGAVPSNEGRGYVLRRLLRRAARFGRNLEMHQPFIYQLVPTLAETMGDVFPEIREKQEHIQKIIKGEEEGFNETLDRGIAKFEEVVERIGHSKTFPGEDAFKLYDTYGFPLDLTELMAAERGLRVDVATFTELMEQQRARSKESVKEFGAPAVLKFSAESPGAAPSEFVGYDALESDAKIVSVQEGYAILDRTPFYGEAGGQVGDTGELISQGKLLRVVDTQRDGQIVGHRLAENAGLSLGGEVHAKVDAARRASIMRNHSATHLLHAALRRILGTHVHQAGSLVAPDYFRFDFAHFSKVGDEELADIETLVNEKIKEDIKLTHHRNIPFEEAKQMGALMFFGDKYGERVNVVQFGNFSMEFCGGTHVHTTGEIGYFKFRSEGSIASGVRRIEAVTSDHALELLRLQDRNATERLDYASEQLQQLWELQNELASRSSGPTKATDQAIMDLQKRLENLKKAPTTASQDSRQLGAQFDERARRGFEIESLVLDIAEKRRSLEKELSKFRVRSLAGLIDGLVQSAGHVNGFKLVSARVEANTVEELKTLGDTLRAKLGSGVGLLGSVLDDKVSLVCVVTDDLVASKRIAAGKVVGAVAKIVGGGGGGKAHLATAGGKDVSKLDEALRATESIVRSILKS